jgi:hypothetical protein
MFSSSSQLRESLSPLPGKSDGGIKLRMAAMEIALDVQRETNKVADETMNAISMDTAQSEIDFNEKLKTMQIAANEALVNMNADFEAKLDVQGQENRRMRTSINNLKQENIMIQRKLRVILSRVETLEQEFLEDPPTTAESKDL